MTSGQRVSKGLLDELGLSEEEFDEIIKKVNVSHAKRHKKPSVPCVCDKCGGRVVRRVSSLFRGEYSFLQPECEGCKEQYRGAGQFDSITVGVEEFERFMRETIYY